MVAGCQKITEISVSQALLHLPHLTVCDYPDTVSIIHNLLETDPDLITRLNLLTLHSGLESREESLSVSCRKCPEAEHVFIVLHPAQPPYSLLSLLDIDKIRQVGFVFSTVDREIDMCSCAHEMCRI